MKIKTIGIDLAKVYSRSMQVICITKRCQEQLRQDRRVVTCDENGPAICCCVPQDNQGSNLPGSSMKHQLLLIALAICVGIPIAQAQQVGETVATPFQGLAHSAKGAHLRDQVNELVALVRAKRLPEAEQKANDLQEKFEASFDRKIRQYSFPSKEEYLEFRNSSPEQFEWIDWGYKEILQMKAFIAADKRNFPTALSILSTIEKIAPTSAGTAAETGYILNQLSQHENALTAYKKALSLSTRYQSQQIFHAVALRGMGFALIELHKLDEAEAVFQDSLNIEPNNKIALNELAYIRNLRAKRQP